MRKILVFQHVAWELLGLLNPLLKQARFRIRYVNFDRHPHAQPGLDGYSGLVILGGPMNAGQVEDHPHLLYEQQIIREALERDIPVLGICLGAQLIAAALGATVGPSTQKEIGWYDIDLSAAGQSDPLLAIMRTRERIFQWHSDTFALPDGAVHLASSTGCTNQAFRYGDKVYGFQFHLEADEPTIERWLDVPAHRTELDASAGLIDPARIRAETPRQVARSEALAHAVFARFIDLFAARRRYTRLPSR